MADGISGSNSMPLRWQFERAVTIRWCMLAAGLVIEAIVITVAFESPAASPSDAWWVRLAAISPELIRIAAAASAAFLLLLGPRLKATIEYAQKSAIPYRWQPWLVLHLLAFATCLTVAVFADGSAVGQISSGRLALCEALAIAAAVFWVLALAPLRCWRVLVGRERFTLVVAVAAAIVTWLGGEIVQRYSAWLASGTLYLAEPLLRVVYPDVMADPEQFLLGTRTFVVHITPQCSGYEGIALITVFLAIYLSVFRSRIRFPHALLLFPIGALAVWLANAGRIAALVAIGTSYSPQLAAGGFHSQAGWISFIAIATAMIAVTRRMRFFVSVGGDVSAEVSPIVTALLVPFLALMASMMVTAALSSDVDRFYPLRVLAMAAALLWFRRIYAHWDWSWSWPSVGIGVVVFVLWLALERLAPGGAEIGSGIAAMDLGEAVLWVGARIVGSVLLVPLVEEMAFRGYLLRRLAAADFEAAGTHRFNWVAFLLSSAAFGLLHGRWLAGTVAGMGYALAFYRGGRLGDAVVAHMTTNGLIALMVLVTGAWSLWS